MVEFERLVAVVNPTCSQVKRAKPYVEDIREAYPNVAYEEIKTSKERERTLGDLNNKLTDGDLCLIVGGDGTVHDVVTSVIGYDDRTILPLWGGHANDLAHMLNGKAGDMAPRKLIEQGKTIEVNPIRVSIDGLGVLVAACYAGFGGTAAASAKLNASKHRKRLGYNLTPVRTASAIATLAPVPFTAKPFTITEHNTGSNEPRALIDMTFANGPRMAIYGRPSAELEEPQIFSFECKTRAQIPRWAGQLVTGKLRGTYLRMGEQSMFKVHETVLGHVDAETFELESGSEVSVGVHSEPFHAVSTAQRVLPALSRPSAHTIRAVTVRTVN